jgi:hypothetical protein
MKATEPPVSYRLGLMGVHLRSDGANIETSVDYKKQTYKKINSRFTNVSVAVKHYFRQINQNLSNLKSAHLL